MRGEYLAWLENRALLVPIPCGQSDWQHDIVHGRQVLASLESRHVCGQAQYTALSPSLAS